MCSIPLAVWWLRRCSTSCTFSVRLLFTPLSLAPQLSSCWLILEQGRAALWVLHPVKSLLYNAFCTSYQFFFPFVLWLYANFVRDEDQGYLFSLIINSLSILFSFLFGRGLHCHRTATVVPTLFSFVCLSAWHCPKINCKGGKWCEGSSLGLNREEISESCF